MPDTQTTARDEDLEMIVGCRNIAAALRLNPNQVTESRRKGGLKFIWKEPGLGLVTTRQAARRYLLLRGNAYLQGEESRMEVSVGGRADSSDFKAAR